MKIQIISGIYGYRPSESSGIIAVSASDPPIKVTDIEAERLIRRHVAVDAEDCAPIDYGGSAVVQVEDMPSTVVIAGVAVNDGDPAGGGMLDGDAELAPDAHEIPTYSIEMKPGQLISLIKQNGLPYKIGTTKEAMVATLDAYFADSEVGEDDTFEDDGEQPPDFTAEEPVT